MPTTRPATVADAHSLAPRLRKADIQEITALSPISPLQALLVGVEQGTECLSIIADDGLVIGLFGIHHHPAFGPNQAAVWMLGSDDLVSIKTEIMRQTVPILTGFHLKYPLLWNLVDARNEVHIRWLKRFGFVALHLHPHVGVEQRPFYEFIRIDPQCATPPPSPSLA